MTLTALKKTAESSKVLLFAIYAAALTAAMFGKYIAPELWIDKLEVGFGLLMGGYSVVEAARAIASGKVKAADVLEDPKAAMDRVTHTFEVEAEHVIVETKEDADADA